MFVPYPAKSIARIIFILREPQLAFLANHIEDLGTISRGWVGSEQTSAYLASFIF
jgi:hypothetical protein